jgi:hypothetical protein
MRAWRTSEGFLVDEGRTATVVISTQTDQLPDDRWKELREFVALDPYGFVLRRHSVSVWSLEDDLGLTAFAVIEGTFRSLTVVLHTGATWRASRTEEVLLPNLRPVLADDVEALELIQEGLKSDSHLRFHKLQERKRDATPAEAPEEDPELKRVFDLLQEREQRTNSLLDKLLMAMLLQCRGLRVNLAVSEDASTGALAAFVPAVQSIVQGCRRAVFDSSLGRDDPAPGPIIGSFKGEAADLRSGIQILVDLLLDVEKRIRVHAGAQQRIDAERHAAEYRKAEVHFAQARERLQACLAR